MHRPDGHAVNGYGEQRRSMQPIAKSAKITGADLEKEDTVDGYELSADIERVFLAGTCSDAEIIAAIARVRNVREESITCVDDLYPPVRFKFDGNEYAGDEVVGWGPERLYVTVDRLEPCAGYVGLPEVRHTLFPVCVELIPVSADPLQTISAICRELGVLGLADNVCTMNPFLYVLIGPDALGIYRSLGVVGTMGEDESGEAPSVDDLDIRRAQDS